MPFDRESLKKEIQAGLPANTNQVTVDTVVESLTSADLPGFDAPNPEAFIVTHPDAKGPKVSVLELKKGVVALAKDMGMGVIFGGFLGAKIAAAKKGVELVWRLVTKGTLTDSLEPRDHAIVLAMIGLQYDRKQVDEVKQWCTVDEVFSQANQCCPDPARRFAASGDLLERLDGLKTRGLVDVSPDGKNWKLAHQVWLI
jgi:hypothetical protein